MDGGAWQAIVHGITENRTRLSDFTSLHRELISHVLWFRVTKKNEKKTEFFPPANFKHSHAHEA